MTRASIEFVRRGQVVVLANVSPTETLLDYLREQEGAKGTKEGCREGDCGACTVALGTLANGGIALEPVNSCITLLGTIDGKEVITVDDLAGADEALHPVQEAMVTHHASQCGFCTPGFVMSLFTLYHASGSADRSMVDDWLAGNLCRCTGYRPIAAAALAALETRTDRQGLNSPEPGDRFHQQVEQRRQALEDISSGDDIFVGDEHRFFAAPASLGALCDLAGRAPDATVVAGATDVGLWITKGMRDLPRILHAGRVRELRRLVEAEDAVELGAGVTYAQAEVALSSIDPDLGELLRRLGGKQVRAAGTVGGNIANGSPIGDMPPALIALGATVALRLGDASRSLPLEDFFIDYGRQDLRPGEILTTIRVPRLAANQRFRCYKISKRIDQDITAVLGAFRLTVEDGAITAARVAFGGMAATPCRALRTEQRLIGLSLARPSSWQAVMDHLDLDYQPLDDLRATSVYRSDTARALLYKALAECSGVPGASLRLTGARNGEG